MPNNITPAEDTNDQRFKDEGTDKRIHEILNNESDSVSEEDINNIITDVAPTDSTDTPRDIDPSDPDSAEHKIKDDSDPEIDNDSWNILSGG